MHQKLQWWPVLLQFSNPPGTLFWLSLALPSLCNSWSQDQQHTNIATGVHNLHGHSVNASKESIANVDRCDNRPVFFNSSNQASWPTHVRSCRIVSVFWQTALNTLHAAPEQKDLTSWAIKQLASIALHLFVCWNALSFLAGSIFCLIALFPLFGATRVHIYCCYSG